MLAIEVSASSFCARETRGTKAKFKTFAETSQRKTVETPHPDGVESWIDSIIASVRRVTKAYLPRHVSSFCPVTSVAYAVVWSHFGGNIYQMTCHPHLKTPQHPCFLRVNYVVSTSACPKAAKSSSVPYMFQKPTNLETLNNGSPWWNLQKSPAYRSESNVNK